MTTDKLALDPTSIHVTARDFMLAMKKVVPSSQRSSSSGTDPLPSFIEPLLIGPLEQLKKCMEGILPERKRLTVLEEAMYEDDQDSDGGFSRENMMQGWCLVGLKEVILANSLLQISIRLVFSALGC